MTQYFSRIPILPLFIASILPLLLTSLNSKVWFWAITLIFVFLFFWVYSITKRLTQKNKYDASLNFKNFTLQLILTNLYIIFITIYAGSTELDTGPKWMLLIMIIGQIFLFWNFIYLTRFIAKTISTLEFKKECHLSDYLGNAVFLVFFPIGIWWLHPRISKLIEE